jgi:hypothetical protein
MHRLWLAILLFLAVPSGSPIGDRSPRGLAAISAISAPADLPFIPGAGGQSVVGQLQLPNLKRVLFDPETGFGSGIISVHVGLVGPGQSTVPTMWAPSSFTSS